MDSSRPDADIPTTIAPLLARVHAHIAEEGLLDGVGRLVVAVSGGADSCCLLDLLGRLAQAHGIEIEVAHFDHRLRPDSEEDARFVCDLAASRGLPFHVGTWHDRPLLHTGSSEAAAHAARYRFLDTVARQLGAKAIAFGHTADDQIETVLMHLLRGSGLRGLVGLAPRRDLAIRPLLVLSSGETRAWCRARGMGWRDDPSNGDDRIRRNRIRHAVVPLLREMNPAIDRGITRTVESLRHDFAYLQEAARAAEHAVIVHRTATRVTLDRTAYRALAPAVGRHLLQLIFVETLPAGRHGDALHLVLADGLIRGGLTGQMIALPGAAELAVAYGRATLRLSAVASRADTPRAGAPALPTIDRSERRDAWSAAQLPVPGAVAPEGAGWRLSARSVPCPADPPGWRPDVAFLDPGSILLPLLVRPRRPGDRMAPAGMGHRQKLQDMLVNARIPRERRPWLPVVVSGNEIVWVGGCRVGESARVDFSSDRPSDPGDVIMLTWEHADNDERWS